MISRQTWIVLTSALAVTACGKKTASESGGTTTDSETKTQKISNGLEDATDAVADNSSSSSTASLITGETDITITRACTKHATDGTVSVVITGSGTGIKTTTAKTITFTTTYTGSGTETRKWTPPSGQTIACNDKNEYVKFKYTDDAVVKGLKTEVTVDKTRSITVNATGVKRNGETVSKTKKAGATTKGTRTITWGVATASDPTKYLARTHTIESSVTRTKTFTNDAGTDDTLETTVKTVSGSPMVVTVERASPGTPALSSKVINSGTVRVTKTGESSVTQLEFSNVKYDFTSTTICVPISGTITTKSFADATTTTESSKCTIKFGEDTTSYSTGISITCDSGSTTEYTEYNTKGCDLERES